VFLDRAADRGRLPVLLLSGFLGSGKTTLVNAVLRDPRLAETAVAINEFGEVPLDQLLVGPAADATIVMANGCLCCNLAGDMEAAVMRLFARRQSGDLPSFRRLIVEPSGLADPAPIAQAILRNPVMSRALRLTGIVATVDAVLARMQMARHPEFARQVALADTVVMTKSDLADANDLADVADIVGTLNPAAPLLHAVQGEVAADKLLPASFLDPDAPDAIFARALPPVLAGHHHASHASSLSLIATQPLRWRAFDEFLRGIRLSLGENLLRVKGIINVVEADGPVVVQGVHHVLHAPVCLDAWPDSDHRTRVVLILHDVDSAWIAASWQEWLAGSERASGDPVFRARALAQHGASKGSAPCAP
jgi:G3E family GTPase